MFIHMYFEFLNKKVMVFNSSKDITQLSTLNSPLSRQHKLKAYPEIG
jgi:hypothetical protein